MVDGVAQPRSKRVSNIMGAARMVVLTLGMPEAEDGWTHVTGPLFHVANQLMVNFKHDVFIDLPAPLLPYHFTIESTGVGNGNLTCDESCRLYDANQLHSHHDGYSLATLERLHFRHAFSDMGLHNGCNKRLEGECAVKSGAR